MTPPARAWLDRLLLIAIAIAACAFTVAIAGDLPVQSLLVAHSDTLLPIAWAENLLRHGDTIRFFQLPRVPSFFPDLFVVTGLLAVLPSWQSVSLAYAILSFVATILIGGAVVARMTRRAPGLGAAALLLLAVPTLLLCLLPGVALLAVVYAFLPVFHSGSLILSLAGLLLAHRLLERPSVPGGAGLFALAAVGVLSDKLFLGSFLLPCLAGCAVTGRFRTIRAVVAWAVAGCLAGLALDAVVFPAILVRQPDVAVNLPLQLSRLPAMLSDREVRAGALVGAVTVLLPLAWARRDRSQWFWWACGASTVIGFLGVLPLLYENAVSGRYLQAVWWWGLMTVATGLLRSRFRLALAGAGAGALAMSVAVAARAGMLFEPERVLAYRYPIEACLAPLAAAGTIHAGLAQYWFARPIEVSSGGRLQVEQIDATGYAQFWGNNRYYYKHAKSGAATDPVFDFIVMEGLDRDAITARFGEPAAKVPCADVWLYPGGVGRDIGHTSLAEERQDIVTGPACFPADDFQNRFGVRTKDGVAAKADGASLQLATFGPYVRVGAGAWQLAFHYDLDGPETGGAAFDVTVRNGTVILASGPLPVGTGQTRTVSFATRQTTTPLEFRTFLAAADRLRIRGMTLTPAGGRERACP